MLKTTIRTTASLAIFLFSLSQTLAQSKPTCAVLTFDARVGVSVPESQMLSDRFATEFDRLGRYTIVARSMMREILDEQEFQATDHCSAAACAVEAGQLLGVRFMVYGTIGRLGGIYSINSFMVDVETGQQIRSATTDMEGEIGQALTWLMSANARQLLGMSTPSVPSVPPLRYEDLQPDRERSTREKSHTGIFFTPRVGISFYSGVVGIEFQHRNWALAAGYMPLEFAGPMGGLKYYHQPDVHSWFHAIGLGHLVQDDYQARGKTSRTIVGYIPGYRWQFVSGLNVSIGLGIGVAQFNSEDAFDKDSNTYQELHPLGDFAVGFRF